MKNTFDTNKLIKITSDEELMQIYDIYKYNESDVDYLLDENSGTQRYYLKTDGAIYLQIKSDYMMTGVRDRAESEYSKDYELVSFEEGIETLKSFIPEYKKPTDKVKEFREFDTGATRDVASGKLEYSRYINPKNDYSFAKYMRGKQIIGGEYRRGDNRQKGMPPEELLESLVRHTESIKLLFQGIRVVETKKDGIIELLVGDEIDDTKKEFYSLRDEKNIITELNALRFNSEALKLTHLK